MPDGLSTLLQYLLAYLSPVLPPVMGVMVSVLGVRFAWHLVRGFAGGYDYVPSEPPRRQQTIADEAAVVAEADRIRKRWGVEGECKQCAEPQPAKCGCVPASSEVKQWALFTNGDPDHRAESDFDER